MTPKEHESDVVVMTKKLVDEHIPKFVEWLVENNSKVRFVGSQIDKF